MTRAAVPTRKGTFGCLDPGGERWRELAAWAEARGAQPVCTDGPFHLWGWRAAGGKSRAIRADGLCGLVAGDLFEAPAEPPEDLIAAAFRRDGPAALVRLNGQFAVYLWDSGEQELLLFRDASSTRAIYYAALPAGGLVFADNLDLLVGGPLVEKRLSRPSLHEYLRFLDVSAPNTIYAGVYSTEPGGLVRASAARIHLEETRCGSPPNPSHTLPGAADELEALLTRAVAARMDPAGTTVTFLSGGVDSSLVCSLAAQTDPQAIEAVTVGFEETGFDESRVAVGVARHLGVRHRVLSFPIDTYRDAFEELTAAIDLPFADPAGVPSLIAFRIAREIGDTALDGTGADTLFGVMPARHQRLAVQYATLLSPPLRRTVTRVMKAVPGLREYAPLVDFDDAEEVLIRWRGFRRSELEELCGEPVSLEHTRFYRLFRRYPRDAHLQRYSTLLGNLPDDRIHQAAAITGLTVRFPYFDPAVTEWVEHLDMDLRYHPLESKRVLKAVLARRVPRALWDFPKHGFDFPFVELMAADDCALVRQYLHPERTAAWGLLDQKRLDALVAGFIAGERGTTFRIWALVVLYAWLENHFRVI